MADGYDACTCLRHFVQEKPSASCGMDKLFIFIFISVNYNPILGTEYYGSGETNSHVFFGEKKMLAGHNPPPLNHGFGVILACTSFLVPVDTIFVVLMI